MVLGNHINVPCALAIEDNPEQIVYFPSFPVDAGIIEGYRADYTATGGRASEPFGRIWEGGDWSPIDLTLDFRAGLDTFDLGPPAVVIGRMINKINWLKATAFPRTDNEPLRAAQAPSSTGAKTFGKAANTSYSGQAADPPYVLFIWGFFMILRGRIISWEVNWKGPFEPISGKPHGAEVSLTFQPESRFYHNWYDVVKGNMPNTLLARLT